MPIWSDWKALGRETFRSVTSEDVKGLWREEWRAAHTQLVSEQRAEIDGEPRRGKRFARSANAVVFSPNQSW